MPKKKKILAVASIGGHWVQLLRIAKPLEEKYDVVYMSTHDKCRSMIGNNRFHRLSDFNRNNAWKMFMAFFQVLFILLRERPSAIITTGAAPGMLTIVVGKILFRKTIWIDSVANVKTLSACGRFARILARYVYTQWPDLADDRVEYVGNIFGDQEEDEK